MEQQGLAVQFKPGSFAVVLRHGEDAADQGDLRWSGDDAGDMIWVRYWLQGQLGVQKADQEEKGQGGERA